MAIKEELPKNEEVNKLVAAAEIALKEYMSLDQEAVDKIVKAMTIAGLDKHMQLAKHAIDETGRGVFEDKVIKNIFATEYIWNSIRKEKSVGVVYENELEGYIEVAEPVGVVAGVTPVTNPTSTTMFKAIICAKTRNPIVFAFHPSAQGCSRESAKILYEAAVKAGAPKNCIQWIDNPSVAATGDLMNHPGVSLILATGGSGMVKAAYSAGKPALGVGAGNTPCYINKTVNIGRACTDLMLSKTFDNGMICASEQAVIVDEAIAAKFEKYLKDNNCYFASEQDTKKLTSYIYNSEKQSMNSEPVGKTASWIAEKAGIEVPEKTKIIVVPLPEPSEKYPLAKETLMPVLAYYKVKDDKQGFSYARKVLELGGLGHTAVIHSLDESLCREYGKAMPVGRIIINSPSSQGAIGDVYNANTPSLTLGCGSYGRNSTTANVSSINLVNRKRVAKRRNNMQWFKVPSRIYFENNSIQYLQSMRNISRVFIVTDPGILGLGYVEKITHYLNKREGKISWEVFSQVEADPCVETIMRGVDAMNNFKPDCIIALGGGSPIDAAKGMWLFYEHPNTDFEGLRQKFLDIRKRAFRFPSLGEKAQFVAIPTTSGTGSEVTAFSVVTDKKTGTKYPLADYELTPDVAIVDPQFVKTLPPFLVADTGMDVLTHAIEAFVSVLASDYTDGLAMQAIEIVFEYLYKSYSTKDEKAKEKMHNASAIAGMAFTNAFLGLNHSMAHKMGGEYNLPHGRANAILLPHIIAYNAQRPDKFPVFPKYEEFIADEKYAFIAKRLGLTGKTTEEKVKSLIVAIQKLMKKVGMPLTVKECGVSEEEFLSKLEKLSYQAFEDQCTTANPRYPLVEDIKEIYKKAYYGK